MAKHGKRYLEAAKKVDSTKFYSVDEAMKLAKETSYANFDATIEVAYNLNVDPKQADQQIRGALVLPNGTGKSKKVVVFAEGPQADQAKEAGADEVGSDDLVEKVQNGYLDFDVVIATPMMMAKVGRLGRILGPKGLMPNPKTGTVTMDVTKAVNEVKAGKVTYRVDRNGNIHVPIGKVSFDNEKLVENFKTIHDVLVKAKPSAAKGQYMKNITITTTFGPGIHVDQASF